MLILSFIRVVIAHSIFVFNTILGCFVVLFFGLFKARSIQDFVVWCWSKSALFFYGINVKYFPNKIDVSKKGVLFLFNHQSHLDIPIICGHLPYRNRFGGKVELFKIPIFGFTLKLAGVLPISRDNRSKVFEVYKNAEKRFLSGESFVLAPEGQRVDFAGIGEFKKGPFIFAKNAEVDLVPIVVNGAHQIMPKGSLFANKNVWGRKACLQVGKAIKYEDYKNLDLVEVVKNTREIFLEMYKKGEKYI